MRRMRILFIGLCFGACMASSGCVIGSGPCLWLQVRHDFVGHVQMREFPRRDGVDTVPILVLDKTQYMYSPPQSFHCLAATELQLVGMSELPSNIGVDTHVIVDGTVYAGVAAGQHTPFVIEVVSVLPKRPK